MDLGGNDMIVRNGSLGSIVGEISQGFKAGGAAWTGDGLISSLAAGSSNTGLGVELNSTGTTALMTTFDSQTVGSADVLVKYTYFGDADLSGTITAADYQLIDNGFNNGGTPNGWMSGDFNYDNVVNGDDYALIDNAFNTQGGVSFAAEPAQQIAVKPAAAVARQAVVGIFGEKQTTQPAAMPTVNGSAAPVSPFSNTFITHDSLADQVLGLCSPA